MAENAIFKLEKNEKIAQDIYLMRLAGPVGALRAPGQFVQVRLSGLYLRRPISVCRWDEGGFEMIYKVVGKGTARMAKMAPGETLDILVGLGNGFDVAKTAGKRTILVGGGVGVPPMLGLAQQLAAAGTAPVVLLGFRTAADVFLAAEFEALGCGVGVSTEDGSAGIKGFVTTMMEQLDFDYYCACGPKPMLRAVHAVGEKKGAAGQLSMEERMGCGFGVCRACTCRTKSGHARVCMEGPVFASEEVVFE